MGIIKRLEENTINKIAAGEVIERPASVVKELIENSIDAGATRVSIAVERGGNKRIRVVDNGTGMVKDDALLSIEKHSTSKIAKIKDLESVSTMGFRGEALSSIASVSKVEMRTRHKSERAGTRITIHGGRVLDVAAVGSNVGTIVDIRDLFYNLPARRKFLKRERTEFGHICDIVTERAIAHPEIHFDLVHNGDVVITSPRTPHLRERIALLFGDKAAKSMVEIGCKHGSITVFGYITKPHQYKRSASDLYLYINRRPVKSRNVNAAVVEGYGSLLMKQQYPRGVIFLDVPPSRIDVNVHPTKREVRFQDEKTVMEAVSQAVADAFKEKEFVPEVKTEMLPGFRSADAIEVGPQHGKEKDAAGPLPTTADQQLLPMGKKGEERPEHFGGAIIIGQLWNTYILLQKGNDFLMVDQHAAHERIRYEKLKNKHQSSSIKSQELISPVTIEVKANEFEILIDNRAAIERLGIEFEEFGRNTIQVRAMPVVLSGVWREQEIRNVVDELACLGKVKSEQKYEDDVLKIAACHSAIRAGEPLPVHRIKQLLEELAATDFKFACAHGRPVTITLTKRELEKMFKRIV